MAKEKHYLTENAKLMAEWDWEKNEKSPDQYTLGSHKKVWWKCSKGHEWEAIIRDRNTGAECPYCLNKRVLPGFNDLETVNPRLAKEWNYDKNNGLLPSQVLPGSDKTVWWICENGHEWPAPIFNRNKGIGCPYCKNREVKVGYNDLATTNPELAKEWNYDKNGNLKPSDVTAGSHKRVWWKCSKGHEWEAIIKDRNSGNGCVYCANKKVLKGYNDLATTNPELAKEWNYEKNGDLKPSDVIAGSQKKVWWKCSKGHEWEASIDSRNRGRSCRYCSNNEVLKGFNDLLTTHPDIVKEWDYSKNNESPNEVFAGSNVKKYWFVCPKGHSYPMTLLNKSKGQGCPICSGERHTSFPEKAIYFYIKKYFDNVIENYRSKRINNKEIDIYLPSFSFGIEYDGRAWHKNAERDLKKDNKCFEKGIKLFRVREIGCANYESDSIKTYITPYNIQELNEAIIYIFDYLNKKYDLSISADVDVDRDRVKILEQIELSEKDNSIAAYCPKIKEFWDSERNGKITPEQISHASFKKVYLICSKGHKWEVKARDFSLAPWCPYCSGRKVLTGFNDLFTTNPELIPLWSNNNTIDPTKVKRGSNLKALWYCPVCKGEYEKRIVDKSNGEGCPYCTGHRVLKGYNDLETVYPEIAKEWNYKKNYPLKPSEVTKSSNKKVWWKCAKCGFEWQATICSRNNGRGCKQCARKKQQKPVKCVETGEVFESTILAAKFVGKTANAICSCALGRKETCGGYHWEYVYNSSE